MEKLETKKALLLALASALTALGWSATIEPLLQILRVPGFPALRTPEVRFSGAPSSPDVRFVWHGYTAKKPETMAARIAEVLKKEADAQKEAEAKRTTPIHLTAAEREALEALVQTRIASLPASWPARAALENVLAKLGVAS